MAATTPTASAWAEALGDAPAVLQIPADRSRPDSPSPRTGSVAFALDAALSAGVRELAAEAGDDVEAVLLAVWRLLLHRLTDEQDLLTGYRPSTAWQAEDEVLVVRGGVPADDDFRALLKETQVAVEQARARQPLAVADLLTALGLEPDVRKYPVFQVALAQLEGPDAERWPRPSAAPVPPDLALGWWWDGDVIRARLDYSRDLFDHWRIERMTGHVTTLLRSALVAPNVPVGLLPLLSEEELSELQGWNDTQHDHDQHATLADRFSAQARLTPDADAVEFQGETLTYAELGRRSDRLARVLQTHGVGPDVRVAICAERSIEMVVGVLAVLKAGGAYVPVDPSYPAARREYMISDSGARIVLTQRALRSLVPAHPDVAVVELEERPSDAVGHLAAPDRVQSAATGSNLGYVIYTSGSTGQPKGVALPQRALTNLVDWQLRRPQFSSGARTLQFSSLSFDVSFQEIFSTWCSGGTLVLVADETRRDPLSLLDVLIESRIARLFLPYVALRGLAAAAAATGRRPVDLREVYTAGEQLQVDPQLRRLFAEVPDCVLENQYGPSESHVVTAHTMTDPCREWPLLPPIGSPIANAEVVVLDARKQLLPVGVPGELYLGGTCLARGYLGKPDLTAERFVPTPVGTARSSRLYRTGDLVRWLPSGELEFLGRLDHQVKFRGYRIEPGEVAAVLSGCPGVSQAVATVREHGEAGSRLTAYLLPVPGTVLDLAYVHRFARENLPSYMVPSHYLAVDDFPLTASGKVDTQALPDAAFDRAILSSPYEAPRNSEELALASIWRSLLGIPEVGVDDDFFELGGDSLMAAEMLELINTRLGRELPLGALAQSPTIAKLAEVLRGGEEVGIWRSLVPLKTEGSRTPLFMVHGGSGNVTTFPVLARALPPDQPVYALQWDGLDGSRGTQSIEAMAERYLVELRQVQPQGPYLLAGQCVGGLIAREMAVRLLERGERVDLLLMYDSPHLGSPAYVPGRQPSALDYLFVRNGRKVRLRVLLHRLLRRPVPPEDRIVHGSMAMTKAVWVHRPRHLPRPVLTHYFGSGESDATRIALTGRWTDGAMGWAHCADESFVIHRIEAEHNEILYQPEAVRIVADLLEDRQGAAAAQ